MKNSTTRERNRKIAEILTGAAVAGSLAAVGYIGEQVALAVKEEVDKWVKDWMMKQEAIDLEEDEQGIW